MSDYADLKTSLLCCGVQLPDSLKTGRKGGAGPAGGRYMVVKNLLVNAPVYGAASKSPFSLEKVDNHYVLKGDSGVHDVLLIEDPYFYQLETEDGILYKKIALLHGIDCLATTVYQTCIRWKRKPCSFCGIELSLKSGATIARKTPEQLVEVAQEAVKEGAFHITLTTGTVNEEDKGALLLSECATALKDMGLPVHVQVEPVKREYLELLKNSGADSIGIHIESVDKNVFEKVCPEKDFSLFVEAWVNALEIFGDNQVSSYVLVGLGERGSETYTGIEKMTSMGVIPYVVPFRPIFGSVLEDHPFPPFDTVKRYAVYAAEVMKEFGVDPFKNEAGCIRCGACSPVKDYLRAL